MEVMLKYIDTNFEHYVLAGDFNSKHRHFGCKTNNTSGEILFHFLECSRAILLNDKHYTFYKNYNCYKEILDLIVCSNSMFSSIKNFQVQYDHGHSSDHFPVSIDCMNNYTKVKEVNEPETVFENFDYGKANWIKFRSFLDSSDYSKILESNDVNQINDFITSTLLEAANP
jgi:hypothetical protein